MSAYKNPEAIGGATREEVEKAKQETFAKNPHVMRACGDVEGRMPDCDRNCRLCHRKHCKFRQE